MKKATSALTVLFGLMAAGMVCTSVEAADTPVTTTRVCWIRGDGDAKASGDNVKKGQWFDTGIVPNATDKVVMKVLFSNTEKNQMLFCSRKNSGSTAGDGAFCGMLMGDASNPYFRFDRNVSGSEYGKTKAIKPKTDVVYTIVYDPKNCLATVTGDDGSHEEVQLKSGDFKPEMKLRVYASYSKGDAETGNNTHNVCSCRLYCFQIYDKDDNLSFDFVPVRNEDVRDDDKTRYGLYDCKNGTFCPNSGTRGFVQCEVPDGENQIPNGSFESWAVIPTTSGANWKSITESGVKNWDGEATLTRPHNTWVGTESAPDGDLMLVIQKGKVASNDFTVDSRGVYELSFKAIARPNKTGHEFNIFIDGCRVYYGKTTKTDVWSSIVARTIALEPGKQYRLTVQGIVRQDAQGKDIDRASIFDCFSLVKVGEDTSGDALALTAYAESESLALVYDGRWNGDGRSLRNLGTAGAAFDLVPKGADDGISNGFIRTTHAWEMSDVAAESDQIDYSAGGCTLEVVSRMDGERATAQNPGDYRGLFSTRSPDDETNTDPIYLLVSKTGHLGVDIATGRNSGWAEADGQYKFDGARPNSVLATRAVRIAKDGAVSYFENGQLVKDGMKLGKAGLVPIRYVLLGEHVGQFYVGAIGAVRLCTKALTDEQIAANAKVDNTRFGTQPDGELLDGYARNAQGKAVEASEVAFDRSKYSLRSRIRFPKAPATPLTDFPVLVRLAEGQPTGFSYAKFPRETIAFVQNDAFLDFEIDTWNDNGVSTVWVSVPSYANAKGIDMVVVNDPCRIPESASVRVWSKAGFFGVWHMNEMNGRIPDSSGHGLTATPTKSGVSSSVAAPEGSPCVGLARYQSEASTDLYLQVEDYSFLKAGNTFTASGVYRRPSDLETADSGMFFVRKSGWDSGDGWRLSMRNGFESILLIGSGNKYDDNVSIPDTRQNWTTLAAVYANTDLTLYTSGAQRRKSTIMAAKDVTLELGIGKNWSGWIDEVRLRGVASDPAWLEAENAMLTDPDAVAYGPLLKPMGLILVFH